MADELNSSNKFMVGVSGARVVFLKPLPHTISMDDAVNLAAWLVALADPAGEKFESVHEAVCNT